MVLVDKILPKLRTEGHRVLIFSQFIRVSLPRPAPPRPARPRGTSICRGVGYGSAPGPGIDQAQGLRAAAAPQPLKRC